MKTKKSNTGYFGMHLAKMIIVLMLSFHFGIGDLSLNFCDGLIEIVDYSAEEETDDKERELFLQFKIPSLTNSTNPLVNVNHSLFRSSDHFKEIPSPPPEQL